MARSTRSTKTRQTPLHDAAKAIDSAKNTARNAFDTLVKRTRSATVATAGEARDMAIATVRKAQRAATAEVKMAKAKTSEAVSSLEKVFEARVSRAIAKLGLPTTKDVRALSRQVAQLQASVDQLRRSRSRARA
jgi:poly(hydroxyalkanoate) granule-associated protein